MFLLLYQNERYQTLNKIHPYVLFINYITKFFRGEGGGSLPYNLKTGQGAFLLRLLTVAKSFLLFNPNLWTPTFSCHQTSLFSRSCFFLVVSIGKIVRNCKLGSAGCGTSWPWVASLQVLLPLFQSDLCLLHLLL